MRILLQRVREASVDVDGETVGRIGKGYLLLLCAMRGDTEEDAKRLAEKAAGLRLFDSPEGKINDRSLLDIGGDVLVVSQFTLAGDVRKGRRPDYTAAASPPEAEKLYTFFIQHMRSLGVPRVESGRFGAMMAVSLTNDGPVTLLLDTAA
ncbi:MAG: D-aminoacyl-tRNA deacylase [Candidatus Peribacteraceae bacterium]|nr:D-aminoacyl-tRNA deacylase [Candidatus Peribacteraceae bacterium]